MPAILLMEDDIAYAHIVTEAMSDVGFDVIHTRNASDALDVADEHEIDLIITDIFVRKMGKLIPDGGIKLTSKIRQIQRRNIPILAISGSFTGLNAREMKSAVSTVGASYTLAKPFKAEELQRAVMQCLAITG